MKEEPTNKQLLEEVLLAFVAITLDERVTAFHNQLGILHGVLVEYDFLTNMARIKVDGFEDSISPMMWVDIESVDMEYKFNSLVEAGWVPCIQGSFIHFYPPNGGDALQIREAYRILVGS